MTTGTKRTSGKSLKDLQNYAKKQSPGLAESYHDFRESWKVYKKDVGELQHKQKASRTFATGD